VENQASLHQSFNYFFPPDISGTCITKESTEYTNCFHMNVRKSKHSAQFNRAEKLWLHLQEILREWKVARQYSKIPHIMQTSKEIMKICNSAFRRREIPYQRPLK
jgi:hypothetical protein